MNIPQRDTKKEILKRIIRMSTAKVVSDASSSKLVWGRVGVNAMNDLCRSENERDHALRGLADSKIITYHGSKQVQLTI